MSGTARSSGGREPPHRRKRKRAHHRSSSRDGRNSPGYDETTYATDGTAECSADPFADQPSLFPNASYEVATAKQEAASRQCDDDGNHRGNGEAHPDLCHTKALPHDRHGRVDPAAFRALVRAVRSRDHGAWEAVPLGCRARDAMRLACPCAAWSWEFEGAAAVSLGLDAAPRASSREAAADLVELYEMALARDVAFAEYERHRRPRRAARRLGRMRGYRPAPGGRSADPCSAASMFRGPTAGDRVGPYLSQFLVLPLAVAGATFDQRYPVPRAGSDFMRTWDSALAAQNGRPCGRAAPPVGRVARHLRDGRSLAWFGRSVAYPAQPYAHAALILHDVGAPFARGNPYRSTTGGAGGKGGAAAVGNQSNEVTLGLADALDAVHKAAACAAKAAWYHKWLVHRRLRPEAMSMLVERVLRTDENPHGLHDDLLECETMRDVFRRQGTLLLSQVAPDGAPCHPSYPSSSAAVGAACASVLKAFFDETWELSAAYEAEPDDGVELVRWRHRRRAAGPARLTVGGELDKLASNLGMAGAFAGIHYRSDLDAGWDLGERVAVRLLQDLRLRYAERDVRFRFRSRAGEEISID